MSTRTVLVRVTADTAGFTGPMRSATATADTFGAAATRSGRGVRSLAGESSAARTALTGVREGATGARTGLTSVGEGATRAGAGLRGVNAASRDVTRGMTGMTGSTRGVSRAFGQVAATGEHSMGRIRTAMSRVGSMAGELGVILAGGEIYKGLKDLVEQGNEYNDSMNKFSEVTRATGGEMRTAASEAQGLGSDLKLPKASAAEAADAMVELAKAGLSARDSITAARGTIQLSSAARTDVGTAARIEGDALDQFGLKASDATMVADTLANVANNTSGELTDLAYALKYVGPTAHSMGISIQSATTAIGLLGKSGIIGETAGTALRSALVNMSKPTKQMQTGLKELGVQAYDSQGNFKGLEYVVGKLHDAQAKLTTQQFTSAAAMAFGKPALSAMTALAHQGTQNFDQMALAVGRQGGAAALAAAESKGLGGAMRGLGKELSSTFLQLYLAVSPSLEGITRGLSSGVAKALPVLKRGIKTAEDLWDIYGPGVEDKLSHAAGGVESAAKGMVKPAEKAVTDLATAVIPLAATIGTNLAKGFHNAEGAAQPVVSGVKDIVRSVSGAGGAMDSFDGRLSVAVQALQKVANTVGDMTGGLRPIGGLLGGVARGFASLPGPIQLSVLGMLALRPFRPQIQAMQSAVNNYGRSAVASFNGVRGAMETQRVLASQVGVSLGRYGSAVAALEARSPSMQAMGNALRGVAQELPADASRMTRTAQSMGTAFRTATVSLPEDATRVQRFGANLRGVSAAGAIGAVNGLKAAGRGLLGVMGGPWGLAITGAFAVMDIFAQHQQAAKQAVADFTGAIQQDSGALGENSRALAAQKLQAAGAFDAARQYGISQGTVESAALGNKNAMEQVNAALQKNATYTAYSTRGEEELGRGHKALYGDAKKLLGTIGDTSGAVGKATQAYKDEAAATKQSATAAQDATNPTSNLQDAIHTLATSSSDASTKATALHNALTLLSGGELDMKAAVAQMNQSMQNLKDSYADNVKKSDGWGKSLLQVDGSLKTTSKNGLTLWNQLQDLNGATAGAASATYDYAKTTMSVPDALKQAEASMQTSYDAAVKAGRGFGLTKDAAQTLAAQMGFIPSNLAITLSTPGLSATQKDLLYVQGLADHLPKGGSIKVTALTADAAKQLEAVGVKIKTLPGGRQMIITAPTAKAQAAIDQLVAKRIPDKTVKVDANTATAIKQLQGVQSKVATTKGKSITVSALTGSAINALQSVGYKVKTLPNHKVSITAPTGSALSNVNALQRAINSLHGKSVTQTVTKRTIIETVIHSGGSSQAAKNAAETSRAGGGIVGHYADGGTPQWIPSGGPIVGPGTGTSDSIPAWVSNGEYVIRAASVARYGLGFLDRINAGRYASGGHVGHYASGGFTYTPTGTVDTLGADTGMSRYTDAVQKLKDALSKLSSALADQKSKASALKDAESNLSKVRKGHHTASQLAAAEKKLASARTAANKANSTVSSDKKAVNAADAYLGLKNGAKAPTSFNLKAYESQLKLAVRANNGWESDLDKIGKKAGSDVEDTLRGMGESGRAMVGALARASTKDFNTIVAQLKSLAPTAQATLADYTKQLTAANSAGSAFQANLLKLAGMGYGDLANQLAAQGDDSAQAVAAAAVKSSASAKSANAAAKANAGLLSSDDLTTATTLLAFLRAHPGAGIADVLASGLDWATVQALAPKIASQIKGVSGSGTFVSQLRGQGIAMAKGGIAPDGANVLFAEHGTGGEAFIPLGPAHRARSTGLLSSVAGMLGYQLTPVGSTSHRASGGGQGGDYRTYNVTLNGARQSTAEQAQDIARHMAFVG